MAFKDVINKLNLSGIGAKFKSLAAKLKRPKSQAALEEPPGEPTVEPSANLTLPPAGETPVLNAPLEERTDPLLAMPEGAGGESGKAKFLRALGGFGSRVSGGLKAGVAKLGSLVRRKSDGMGAEHAASVRSVSDEAATASAESLIQVPEGASPFQRFMIKARGHAALALAAAKTHTAAFAAAVKANFPKNIDELRAIKPDELMERVRQMTGGRATGTYLRLGAAAFAAYFLADTVSLFTDSLIPDAPPVPAPLVRRSDEKRRSVGEYEAVTRRNIFSSKNIIPPDDDMGNPEMARKTNLPLQLIGTVVLRDELKSIATIEDKSVNMVFPVRIEDTVNDRIQIKKIEHLRVTFVNKSTGQWEYVEIVEDAPILRVEAQPKTSMKKGEGGITALSETHVQIEQKVIRDGMSNLNEVLQQARAIPNFENGMPDGYKILQIVPGSIFEKLNIKNGDVITGLNGDPISDPGKALSLLNDLPNMNHVQIGIKRNGRKMNMEYDIR